MGGSPERQRRDRKQYEKDREKKDKRERQHKYRRDKSKSPEDYRSREKKYDNRQKQRNNNSRGDGFWKQKEKKEEEYTFARNEQKNNNYNSKTGKQSQQLQLQQKTHVPCRRCKQPTFSLKTRTCSKCGYPKQQRPKFFPVVKQINLLEQVREGKLVHNSYAPVLIQVVVNDRFGKKQRIKCCPNDTVFDFKKLISAQTGTRPEKIRLQKANIIFKDHLSLQDYQIKDGMGLQMYYD